MTYSLLFHDSEVVTSAATQEYFEIQFSAAHVLQAGDDNPHQPKEGFSRNVRLRLFNTPQLDDASNSLIGRISHGRIRIDGQWSATLPLPCAFTAPIQLELSFANQSSLELEAGGLECHFEGEPNFHESMAC